MSSPKEETLSPDELRKRLYQTFKNRGVLDTLKVSHNNNNNNVVVCCLPSGFVSHVSRRVPWSRLSCGISSSTSWNRSPWLEETPWPEQWLSSPNPSCQRVTASWQIISEFLDMSTASPCSAPKVACAKARWASAAFQWTYCCFTCRCGTQMHRGNVDLVCFWQVSETEELLHLLHISPATAFYRSLVIKYSI